MQLTLAREQRILNGKSIVLSVNTCSVGKSDIPGQKNEIGLLTSTTQEINFKWIKDLS